MFVEVTLTPSSHRALNEPNLDKRANIVLGNAEKLKCKVFLKPKDIVAVYFYVLVHLLSAFSTPIFSILSF
jgi:hypothetical protein